MNRKIIYYLFFIFLSFLSIIFSFVVFKPLISEDISINLVLYSIGKLAGLIGFVSLSFLIFSGDTARFFDRYFGMDKIIKFQRKLALITAVFIIAHPLFFSISNKAILPYIIPDFTVLPLALGTISFYIFIIIMICSILYKRISYNAWQYIHILTYILFFFSLYHALNIGSGTGNFFVKSIFGILLIVVVAGGIYRTYYKLKQRNNKFIVEGIKWETKDTFTLVLEPNYKFLFKPGQFCFLRLNKDRLYARHPFTISSSPDEKNLHFTIKTKGRFTWELMKLKKGEEVKVDGPFGIFTLDKAEDKDIVLIAGGIGITPFFSMIKSLAGSHSNRKIILFYCSKKAESMVFKKELDAIKEKWLKKIYVLSDDECCFGLEKGRLNASIISKYAEDINKSVFFICGPEEMKKCIVKELVKSGVKKENILAEDFFL